MESRTQTRKNKTGLQNSRIESTPTSTEYNNIIPRLESSKTTGQQQKHTSPAAKTHVSSSKNK
ncbi:hypothetical protein TSUD_342170 [Trifolium subterraneum]|nr:hypothetical protein TSUD_342170 [Trifolium subterraneum]